MLEQPSTPPLPSGASLRHADTADELAACFPVVRELRPLLKDVAEWVERARAMKAGGYRVLAAWDGARNGDRVLAIAGYRVTDNLIHGRFLYVDDLVTAEGERGRGLGAALLTELAAIGTDEGCRRLVLDTAAANTNARRFYKREGLLDLSIGFVKSLEAGA
jgi:ribosomal protein S18 acetylase RimI-like enzyme